MIPQTGNEELRQIVDGLSTEYFEPLSAFCDRLDRFVGQFENKALFIESINYSTYLTGEVRRFLVQRIEVFLPYLHELTEKSATGHDCANCSGKCDMQHTLKLMEFTDSLRKMQNISSDITREFMALNSCKEGSDDALAWLINEVQLMGNLLDELLEKEDTLIPNIQYAQKNINAHS